MDNVVVSGPSLVNILGMSAPLISIMAGVGAVVLVRIMLLTREIISNTKWWVYNVALTALLMLAALILIVDRKLGPGSSMLLGIGLGSSGIVLIDIAKRYLEVIVGKTAHGSPEEGKDDGDFTRPRG
jgi:hypothetical protein